MSSVQSQNSRNPGITYILQRMASEVAVLPDGTTVSKAEALAGFLWDIVLYKQVTLPSGERINATNSEWFNVAFQLIERMEGKPLQQLSAEINGGIHLTRAPRLLADIDKVASMDNDTYLTSDKVDTTVESHN